MSGESKPTPLTEEGTRLVLAYREQVVGAACGAYRQQIHAGYISREEVEAEAMLGLVAAAARWPEYCKKNGFSEDEGFFKTYAIRRAKGAVMDYLRLQDPATRSARKHQKEDPTYQLPSYMVRPISMEAVGTHENPEMENTWQFRSDQPGPHEQTEADRILSVMVDTIRAMPFQTQALLALHYYEGHELQAVGKMIGLTESLASRYHTEAVLEVLKALRSAAREDS